MTSADAIAGLPPLAQAAHERRAALLAALPLGDLAGRVCVAYGDGSAAPGTNGTPIAVVTLVAGPDGERLALGDASVDVFFAGDLTAVDDPEGFLDEVHRVLRPDGVLVATGTNAAGYLFARTGARHGVSPARPSLMSHAELRALLDPRFAVAAVSGVNTALAPGLDERIADPGFARAWAGALVERPDLATEAVLLARPRREWRPSRRHTRIVGAEDPAVRWDGPWAPVTLHGARTGRLGTGADASALTVDVEGTDVILLLWSHAWSGHASVEVDGVLRELVDLYDPQTGFRRLHLRGLPPGPHRVSVRGSAVKHLRSAGTELGFHKLIAYDDPNPRPAAAEESTMHVDVNFRTRPGRFGVIYTTTAHMTSAERVFLYATVFGLRPRRVLEVGTYQGGSALVIGAALDDIGEGTLVCVDPAPDIPPDRWAQIAHRATLLPGPSPDLLPRAQEVAGGPFDLALIDGDHGFAGVVRDIEGAMPVLAPDAHLLFHDAHYFEVAEAIDRMLAKHADRLVDCGMMTAEQTPENRLLNGRPVVWGGLRLLRYHRPG